MTDDPQFPEDIPEALREFLEKINADPEMGGAVAFNPDTGEVVGGEDLPEEIREMLPGIFRGDLGRRLMSGHVHNEWIENTNPSKIQLDMQPGDAFLISEITWDTPDLTVGVLLDPAQHAVEFPDWEERLFNGFRLAQYKSNLQDEETTGWMPLVSLVPLRTDAEVVEAEIWRKEGHVPKDHVVWWIFDRYRQGLTSLMQANDDPVPAFPSCVFCGGKNLYFETVISQIHRMYLGVDPDDEEALDEQGRPLKYIAYAKYNSKQDYTAMIRCVDCGRSDDLYARGAAILVSPEFIEEPWS